MFEPTPVIEVDSKAVQERKDQEIVQAPAPVVPPEPRVIIREIVQVKEVVRDVPRPVPMPDKAWPYVALSLLSAAVGITLGSILIHNQQAGAAVIAVLLLLGAALFSLSRFAN